MGRRVTPPRRVTSPAWEPHLHVNRPLGCQVIFYSCHNLVQELKSQMFSPLDKLFSACKQNRRCEEFGLVIESPCHFLNHQLRLVFVFASCANLIPYPVVTTR